MPRRIGFALSVVAALVSLVALASQAPAQTPTEQPAAQTPGDATDPGTPSDPAPGQEDLSIEELEGVPEDPGAITPPDVSKKKKQAKRGETDTAGAQAEDGDRDCDDFETQAEAQDYFTGKGGDDRNNVDGLDGNGDGVVCEALGESLAAPTGGVDAGAGGTAPRPELPSNGPLPFLLGGAALGLMLYMLSLYRRGRRVGG